MTAAKAEYLGRDDFGNEVWSVTFWNLNDPDDCETHLHTEWAY